MLYVELTPCWPCQRGNHAVCKYSDPIIQREAHGSALVHQQQSCCLFVCVWGGCGSEAFRVIEWGRERLLLEIKLVRMHQCPGDLAIC